MSEILKRATFEATNSHQLSIVVVPIITGALATACVALRFRARYIQRLRCLFDDWLALVALILTWIFQGVNLAAVFAGGAGLPIETVIAIDPTAVTTYLKIILANFSLWVVTVSVVQLSILFFYIRIFSINKVFAWLSYVMVVLVTTFAIAGLFSEIFSCVPVSKSWDPTVNGTCVDGKSYCSAIGIIHVVFDLAIVTIPLPFIWRLKIAKGKKVVLSVLLCLGLVATIISLLKIVCLFDLTGIPQADVTDYLWLTILFQTVELPIGIICCCVPSLKPVMGEITAPFNSLASRLLSYSRRTDGQAGSNVYTSWSQSGDAGTDSKSQFVRLDSSFAHVGREGVQHDASAQAEEYELSRPSDNEPKDSNAINVSQTYAITRL
ncbi:hypothetical protein EKO27_g5295 [Xylaria grammica]|uniref:Rhodopsin domain-containing protein n=1 Tax=Xylaria grammica TaxID=363999 RepID=A0A439D5Z1_9PEZI|nr:hypothetical protein EKO27_g5295 [Xylaria grammica]